LKSHTEELNFTSESIHNATNDEESTNTWEVSDHFLFKEEKGENRGKGKKEDIP